MDTFPGQGGYSPKRLVCHDRNKTDGSIKDTIYQVKTSSGDSTQMTASLASLFERSSHRLQVLTSRLFNQRFKIKPVHFKSGHPLDCEIKVRIKAKIQENKHFFID